MPNEQTEQPYILVTGSSGLIGSAVSSLFALDHPVVGFDVDKPAKTIDNFKWFEVDLTDDASVNDAVAAMREQFGDRIASVVHLAAYYDFAGEPSPLYDKVTVQGTRRLLEALKPLHVEQFIFSSTMLVHAPCKPGERIDEDHPLEPAWDYPESKLKTEQVIHEHRGDTPAVNLRIAGVYDDDCHSIPLAHQIQRIYEERMTSHVYPGDLDCGQSFVHLDDLLEAFRQTVNRRDKLPEETAILIGEPITLSYGELQEALGKLIHDKSWKTQTIPKPIAKAGAWVKDNVPIGEEPFIKPWMIDHADDHFELNVDRAKKLLQWEPKRTLAQTLPRMVEALKADPESWYREHNLEGAAEAAAK